MLALRISFFGGGIPIIFIICKIILLTRGTATVAAVILKFSSCIFFGSSIIAKTSNVKAYLEYQNMFNRFTSLGTVAFGERVAKGTLMLNSNARQVKTARDYAMKTIEALTENDGFYNWTCFCVGLAAII